MCRFSNTEPTNNGIRTYHYQVLYYVCLWKMTWNVLHEITIGQFHHILSTGFFGLFANMLVSSTNLIFYFVKTLKTTNRKGSLLSPYFHHHNPRIGNLSNDGSVSESLSLFSCQSFFIIFEMCLIRDGLLIKIFNFICRQLRFLFWFLFIVLFLSSEISFYIVLSHFYFQLVNFLL